MESRTQFRKETRIAHFQGRNIIVEDVVPVLPPEQREKRKKEIEYQLYDVFRKYRQKAE